MRRVEIMAIGAAALLGAGVAYQLGLAAGAPYGDATLGGRAEHVDGVLATRFRVIAAVSGGVLLGFAAIVLRRVRLIRLPVLSDRAVRWATWNIGVLLMFNTLGNLAAPHALERWGMGAITLVAGVLTLGVARWADREVATPEVATPGGTAGA
ncbi:MAG: hypothetical protein H6675_05300 [Dehalococcoidia bacterium]|nr:hypothetical protein [Dehalococcoidia bacterium]